MGMDYAILSIPKDDDKFSTLSHHFIWYQSEKREFYVVWSDMPTYCRYCHVEGHAVPDCPKKRPSRVCWSCHTSEHIAAERTKGKNKPFKNVRKAHTALSYRAEQGETQSSQISSSTALPSTSSQSFTLNTMRYKRSIINESGDGPRTHSSTLLTIEEDSILVSTQEVLTSLFAAPTDSQDDI